MARKTERCRRKGEKNGTRKRRRKEKAIGKEEKNEEK